jgi:quercetin dioxygenase-like cupin family protein
MGKPLSLLLFLACAAPAAAQHAVPVHQEPGHRLVFDSVRFRIMDVRFERGDTSLYHIHDAPIFYVAVSTSATAFQRVGESWSDTKPDADPGWQQGDVDTDTAYATQAVRHRIAVVGTRPFHLIGVTNARPGAVRANIRLDKELPGVAELQSSWFRQTRVRLQPGKHTDWLKSPLPVVIVQPFALPVELTFESSAQMLRSAGSWAVVPANTRYRLQNAGKAPANVVAIQIQ